MKTHTFILILVTNLCWFQSHAQNSLEKNISNLHEVKITITAQTHSVWNYIFIDYERILTTKQSVGTIFSGNFNFNQTLKSGQIQKYAIVLSPYYRYYPFTKKKKVKGLFLEADTFFAYSPFKIAYQKITKIDRYSPISYDTDYYYHHNFDDSFHYGLGLSLGVKFLTKKNFVWEILFGTGTEKNIANSIPSRQYYKIGILFGKRF